MDVLEHPLVVADDKVDGDSLAAEATRAPDTMEVVLGLSGKVIVDHQRHLLDVNAASEEVGGDEDTGGSRAELAHDDVTGVLVHVSVGGRDSVVPLPHLVSEPVHLPAGVGENDRLGDGEGLVEVAEGVELEVLLEKVMRKR